MLSGRLLAGLTALGLLSGNAVELRVIRVVPVSPADPASEVTVTFDRPVAGGLDATVDPAAIFHIEPEIAGRLEWRDPLTLRFQPDRPLTPGQTYRVTITPDFKAMDGSTLGSAFVHEFTVSWPRVLAGHPVTANGTTRNVPERPTLRLLVSAPVNLAEYAGRFSILLDRACGGGTLALHGTAQRYIGQDDPAFFRWQGLRGPMPDSARDLRRVIELEPISALPLDCDATLRVPMQAGPEPEFASWRFRTYGPLRLVQARCGYNRFCPTGPVRLQFSTPVSGAEVRRRVHILPTRDFTIRDSTSISTEWILDVTLEPRTSYAAVIEPGLTDIFGQQLQGRTVRTFNTTGYAPGIAYDQGRLLIERNGLRTLAVQHVNVDTLILKSAVVPDSLVAHFVGRTWNWEEPWAMLAPGAETRRIVVRGGRDERRVTGVTFAAPASGSGLLAVQVTSPQLDSLSRQFRPIALVQITNLAVHARIGADEGFVWVTGVNDGMPRAGVEVELRDILNRVLATAHTDANGLARLRDFRNLPADEDEPESWVYGGLEGFVVARTADDRAIVGINPYDPDLAPWRFGVYGAWERDRLPAAAAVFTERGIYRPGEVVYAKAIVREGALGALRAPAGDSLRWTFRDREGGVLRDSAAVLSDFGTADAKLALSSDLPLGTYTVQIDAKLDGEWRTLDETSYQVAEYRPPEFLVDAVAAAVEKFVGDTADVTVSGRYLFGAPMAHSPVEWTLRVTPRPLGVDLPGAENFTVGSTMNWWESSGQDAAATVRGADTLDAGGARQLRIPIPAAASGRPATATLIATVTDANRQTGSAAASFTVHPAAFYIGARTTGDRWFWTAGEPVTIEVIALRPDGQRVSGLDVRGTVVRREWHRVRRVRGGIVDETGSWVADTVANCTVRTAAQPVPCTFTPPSGGSYTVTFTARDSAGRDAMTTLSRWASGPGFVPWNDDSQLKMDVIPDRPTYDVGDTATVFFASPFTDAEAWVTIERERVLESRRMRITSGATTLRIPLTEAHAPNVYISIIVVRGRSAPPGPLDDPGRPAMRVGYAQLRILPGVKRLAVDVTPLAKATAAPPDSAEPVVYEPGDTARIDVRVRDAAARGVRAEVTLWAVDEGVLALTGYRVPDPVSLIYRERGLGLRLASNLTNVAAQIPDGQKGEREAGGGGGGENAGILRSRFQTTAFFLGSVLTDANGVAQARAKLPDNLTTFRVMAVAVTNGDRYGSGQSEFLVTRPLVARPSLPRFVRENDRFRAGVVVNQRAGGTPRVEVEAKASGIKLEGRKKQNAQLAPGRGVEVRFDFNATAGDSARFQFAAAAGRDRDAVAIAVPVKPWYHPLYATVSGVLHDTATAEFELRSDIDENRSRIEISFGTSPLALIDGVRETLRVYPYYCSEQISSVALPLIALYRARTELALESRTATLERDITTAVRTLIRRQTPAGSIGFWSANDWSSPWLSAWAGRVLIEARDAGIAVDSAVLDRIAGYLERSLAGDESWRRSPLSSWHEFLPARLSERLAAADFLSRLGRPDVAVENSLLQQAARMRWEDRVLLAELLARRNELQPARQLLEEAWRSVRVDGRKAVLPDVAGETHYFRSSTRPLARLLMATLRVEPQHQLIGPLVEALVDRGRGGRDLIWNTQDYGQTVLALLAFERRRQEGGETRIIARGARGSLFDARVGPTRNDRTVADTSFNLSKLVTRDAQGRRVARLRLESRPEDGTSAMPVWFFATVSEVPRTRTADPVDRGIVVERWYEHIDTREPIVEVREGELVRVRLRIAVPAQRHFVVLDDPLPAGLEPVDLSLRTVAPQGATFPEFQPEYHDWPEGGGWWYGSWDSGIWSPFDHREMRDDRVVWSATVLWPGQYSATYIARATTAGRFVVPPAHAEEMYNPGVNGRSTGLTFTVTPVTER